MKKQTQRAIVRIVLAAITVTTIVVLAGCPMEEEETTSISERIDMFMEDVNAGSYDNLYTHFHPDSSTYTQGRAATTWNPGTFASNTTYTLGTLTISGDTATSTLSGGTYSSDSITFTMKEDGSDNWKILSISGAFTRS